MRLRLRYDCEYGLVDRFSVDAEMDTECDEI